MKNTVLAIALAVLALNSCKKGSEQSVSQKEETTAKDSTPVKSVEATKTEVEENDINPATTNEAVAEKIRTFLTNKYKNELHLIPKEDRKFSFYEVDLNDDKKNEYFVGFHTPYFCGTGGCSFYILNNDYSVNSYFTVTSPPIFRSAGKTNGWHDLILFGDGDPKNGGIKNYIHLKFDKSTQRYPSNPSLIKKSELAPSGHDFIMWDQEFSRYKVFTF